MKKFIQNKLKDQKGLTLIELLAVIVILAIIAAIAIPAIGNIIENSRNGAVKSDYQNALAAANIYFTENADADTVTILELDGSDTDVNTSYLEDRGSLEDGVTVTRGTEGASNRIYGNANGTDYQISSPGLTNSELGAIENSAFSGTIGTGTGGGDGES